MQMYIEKTVSEKNDDYIVVILSAIEYIELHICDKIGIEDIAHHVNYSLFHFMKIFHSITGQNLGVYFFRRRMTNAASILGSGKESILSVAINCGYNSQEAFSRAFKDYFKITPKKYRTDLPNLSNLFCFPLTRQDIEYMCKQVTFEFDIVNLDEITLIGFDYCGDNKKKEISVLINDLLKNLYEQNYCDISIVDSLYGYQSMDDVSYSTNGEVFYYFAGISADDRILTLKDHIRGMNEITIPANMYAKFTFTSRIEMIHTDIEIAYRSLYMNEEYVMTDDYAFEKYNRDFLPNDPNSKAEFYIPIKRK